ncbi:hypothetical protein PVAP13_3NG179370 [Panicum virgatum]|uniref:Uncharacterized protein n=1 Tax=Panicum virgatum TaxID=38727 RepID=A0A8T0U895_PANVG|nr:hypothetical protein PVAP13_3NG179370 [Panicum virgatum]
MVKKNATVQNISLALHQPWRRARLPRFFFTGSRGYLPSMAATRLCHRKVFPSGLQQKISPTVGKVVSMEMAANLRWVQSSTRESSRQVVDGAR